MCVLSCVKILNVLNVSILPCTGYELPWEASNWTYPPNFASPCQIAVEASNGASDYGNKFGEPVLAGFSRSFGMLLGNNERREWIKPIMFSGGIGSIDERHVCKHPPETGMPELLLFILDYTNMWYFVCACVWGGGGGSK